MNGIARFLDSLMSPKSADISTPERSWLDAVWRLLGCEEDDLLDLSVEPETPEYYGAEAMDCLITPASGINRGLQPYWQDGGDRIYSYEHYRLVRSQLSLRPRGRSLFCDGELDRPTGKFSLTYFLVDLPELIFRRTALAALVAFISYTVSIPAEMHNQLLKGDEREPATYQDYYVNHELTNQQRPG